MKLVLIRHGEAQFASHFTDMQRPLTPRGHLQASQTAQAVVKDTLPDLFVVSPLLRAQETLAYLQREFPHVPSVICPCICPDDDASVAIDWLSRLEYDNIVVVCHMNIIAYMASQLTNDHFMPFELAEMRIYEQTVIANGLSTQRDRFVPNV